MRKLNFQLIILCICIVLPDSANCGKWRRGITITSLVPSGSNYGVRLANEDVTFFVGEYWAKFRAVYMLENTTSRKVSLKAGIWREGDDYVTDFHASVRQRLFQSEYAGQFRLKGTRSVPSADIVRLFAVKGIVLSSDSIISDGGPDEAWRILDGRDEYLIDSNGRSVKVFGGLREVPVEMLQRENQAAFAGPDYLVNIVLSSLGSVRVELEGEVPLTLSQDGTRWLSYAAQYGVLWHGQSDEVRIRFVPFSRKTLSLREAAPVGYRKNDGVLIWEDIALVRAEKCIARYR